MKTASVPMRLSCIAASVLSVCTAVAGQANRSGSEPKFTVTSVRKYVAAGGRPFIDIRNLRGGRFAIHGMPLRVIVRTAYPEISDDAQVVGLPGWGSSDLWDIEATFEPVSLRVASPGEIIPVLPRPVDGMLRQLLADRFSMKSHLEHRDSDVYQLRQVRRGRLGPLIQRSAIDCMAPGVKVDEVHCGLFSLRDRTTSVGFPLIQLAAMLANNPEVARPVDDMTGLTGPFDFAVPTSTGLGNSSIFTWVQEQLGLRLVPARRKSTILVIESIYPASPN
jgi:uncharacterized protein (TIGR03435 family)